MLRIYDCSPADPEPYVFEGIPEHTPWATVTHEDYPAMIAVVPVADVFPHFDVRCPCLPKVTADEAGVIYAHRPFRKPYPGAGA